MLDFHVMNSTQTRSCVHPTVCPMGALGFFDRIKVARLEGFQSPVFNAEFQDASSSTAQVHSAIQLFDMVLSHV